MVGANMTTPLTRAGDTIGASPVSPKAAPGGGASVSDLIYSSLWNGVTNIAPSKNAVYDKIETLGGGYTDEQAQDAVGGMVDASLAYVDATPLLQRAALTGDVTASAGSNATTIADAAVTLAKMANLAQDQFIGRVTASTGVPETATITAAARTVLDDANVAAMLATLGGQPLDATLTELAAQTITEGCLLFGVAADDLSVLAKGTAGQVLTMNAGATAPEWAASAGGTTSISRTFALMGA